MSASEAKLAWLSLPRMSHDSPARDEPEPLVGSASFKIPDNVPSKVEGDTAEVGDRKSRDFDGAEVVGSAMVVGLVEVAVLAVVDGLIIAEGGELLLRMRALSALGTWLKRMISEMSLRPTVESEPWRVTNPELCLQDRWDL